MKTKYCSSCDKTKAITEFNERTGYQRGMYSSFCKTCMSKRSVAWKKNNRVRYNLYQANYRKEHYVKKELYGIIEK